MWKTFKEWLFEFNDPDIELSLTIIAVCTLILAAMIISAG